MHDRELLWRHIASEIDRIPRSAPYFGSSSTDHCAQILLDLKSSRLSPHDVSMLDAPSPERAPRAASAGERDGGEDRPIDTVTYLIGRWMARHRAQLPAGPAFLTPGKSHHCRRHASSYPERRCLCGAFCDIGRLAIDQAHACSKAAWNVSLPRNVESALGKSLNFVRSGNGKQRETQKKNGRTSLPLSNTKSRNASELEQHLREEDV